MATFAIVILAVVDVVAFWLLPPLLFLMMFSDYGWIIDYRYLGGRNLFNLWHKLSWIKKNQKSYARKPFFFSSHFRTKQSPNMRFAGFKTLGNFLSNAANRIFLDPFVKKWELNENGTLYTKKLLKNHGHCCKRAPGFCRGHFRDEFKAPVACLPSKIQF